MIIKVQVFGRDGVGRIEEREVADDYLDLLEQPEPTAAEPTAEQLLNILLGVSE